MLQRFQIQFIFTCSQSKVPCLMICRNDNQGFIRMLLIKIDRLLYRFLKIDYLVKHSRRIVTMTGPIDQSAFDHHEKTVLFILTQKIDRSLCNLFK